jgi:hypothetical protein
MTKELGMDYLVMGEAPMVENGHAENVRPRRVPKENVLSINAFESCQTP